MYTYLYRAIFLFITLGFVGCIIRPPASNVKSVTYDYTPKDTRTANSTDFLLALVNPQFAEDFESSGVRMYEDFRRSMGNDFEEMAIAKGFRIKGPFEARDEMLYGDKEGVQMLLEVEIVPQFNPNGQWRQNYLTKAYSYSGVVDITGKINLTGIEPMTNEKIWSKSVVIPAQNSIAVRTERQYSVADPKTVIMDPGVYNPIGEALSKVYASVMGKVEAHLSPEEFVRMKDDIRKLKSKKGF